MRLLIRSWNVFHGRTSPPGRSAHLEQAVSLVLRGGPDVVCLQEVPVWGLRRLAGWSGMKAITETTVPAGLGPLRLPLGVTRRVTDVHHGRLRSLVAGQGNAVLVGGGLEIVDTASLVVNDRAFRREHRHEASLERLSRLRWAVERRVAQAVRVEHAPGETVLLLNLHASHLGEGGRVADLELARIATFAETIARAGEPVVLAGDFNVMPEESRALAELVARGYSTPGPGIDHVLVRGIRSSPLHVWPDDERRVAGGRLLSDHPPVELTVDLGLPEPVSRS